MSTLAWGCHNNSQTHLLWWWFVVLICQSRSITRSCQYQVLITHSPSSSSLFFSPFLSFYLLGRFQINLNYIFILSNELSCRLDICRHTRISWFPFFIFLCIDLFLWRYHQIVPCWHTWLARLSFFNASGGMISPSIFSYRSAIDVLSAHEVAGN